MEKVKVVRVNGCRKVSRKVLERNVLDYLTMNEDADFEECLAIVEEATNEELVDILTKASR